MNVEDRDLTAGNVGKISSIIIKYLLHPQLNGHTGFWLKRFLPPFVQGGVKQVGYAIIIAQSFKDIPDVQAFLLVVNNIFQGEAIVLVTGYVKKRCCH